MTPVSTPSAPSDPRQQIARQPRLPVVLAVELSSKSKPGRCGVTRNASGKGLLIITPSRFAVGDELDLAVHVGDHSGRASARVVRVEENAKDSCETWRYRLAVELDGALPESLLEEARARAPFAKAG
jgi:hypothetical protein